MTHLDRKAKAEAVLKEIAETSLRKWRYNYLRG